MQLAQEDNIMPGIYRTYLDSKNGVPGIREPEFESNRISLTLQKLIEEDNKFDPTHDGRKNRHFPKRTYFSTIEYFLEAWVEGYRTGRSQFGTNSFYEKQGFELFYVNWKSDTPFFKIGNHEGINMIGGRVDLNPIMVLGDNNGMNDQEGYINLGVNDFRTQKVLVFRGPDVDGKSRQAKVNQNILFDLSDKKILRDDLNYYVFDGPDTFPFESPNRLKSIDNGWTAVGIDPLEIYHKVENLGFVFPK